MITNVAQEVYGDYVYTLIIFSATTLSFYATLTNLSQEIEHIWCNPFSLPTVLYIFARYGTLAYQGLQIPINFTPLGRTCNILANVENTIFILSYIGIQGLLVLRAYSMCQRNVILLLALAFGFFSCLGLILYVTIAFPGCVSNSNNPTTLPPKLGRANLAGNIIIVSTDLLISGICVWKVWGVWRLGRKYKNENQRGSSVVSVFLIQSISTCCFVAVITIVDIFIGWLQGPSSPLLAQCFSITENALSAVLVADFTLDLRRNNSARIDASQISLTSFQFSNVLRRVPHQPFPVGVAIPSGERNPEEDGGGFDYVDFLESANYS